MKMLKLMPKDNKTKKMTLKEKTVKEETTVTMRVKETMDLTNNKLPHNLSLKLKLEKEEPPTISSRLQSELTHPSLPTERNPSPKPKRLLMKPRKNTTPWPTNLKTSSSNSRPPPEDQDMLEKEREKPKMLTTLLPRTLESLPDMLRTSQENLNKPPPSKLLPINLVRSSLLVTKRHLTNKRSQMVQLPRLVQPKPSETLLNQKQEKNNEKCSCDFRQITIYAY
jgi:hypothetical protein